MRSACSVCARWCAGSTDVGHDDTTDAAIGNAWLLLQAVRGRAIESVRRLDAGETVGPDASADKVLLARAEQALYEVARHATDGRVRVRDRRERHAVA